MQITESRNAPTNQVAAIREGVVESRVLLAGKPGAKSNHRVTLSRADTDWKAPRHRHNFDQVRYTISGQFEYVPGKMLPEGWVGYFPEGIHYGPQVRHKGLSLVLFQFSGASGMGYVSAEDHEAAARELRSKGSFEKGEYVYVDERGEAQRKDAYEAVWEHVMGRGLQYPKPRYSDVITMDPRSYAWIENPAAPGISEKALGTFTERDTRISFVRIESGATYFVGGTNRSHLLFLASGTVEHSAHAYGPHTAFGIEPQDGKQGLKANQLSEILVIDLPRF